MLPRKRPLITIPSVPQSLFSGNAFAIAKARDDDALDRHRERSNAFYALEKKSATPTPTGTLPPTASNSQKPSRVLKPDINTLEVQDFTPMTTMTQFIDAGKEKLQGMPVTKVPTSVDQSVAGGKPNQSQITRGIESKGNEGTQATMRATIEARHEKKLFKIMGTVPTTPTSSDSERDEISSTTFVISKVDLSDACTKAAVKVR